MSNIRLNHRSSVNGQLSAVALSAVVVALLVPVLLSAARPAFSAASREDSTTISIETVRFDSGGFNLDALVAKPAGGGMHPAVLIIHDNQGLNDGIREIVGRFAKAGFVALAPDFTSRLGGTRTPDQMAQAVAQLSPNATVQDARAALAYLQKNPEVDGAKISAIGFGWGGWRAFTLATSSRELFRAVIYCGATPSQNLDQIHAEVLAHYAQYDFRTTGNALLTEQTLTQAGKKFTYFVYPQVNRAFYTPGTQFNAGAAETAWNRTIDFLQK